MKFKIQVIQMALQFEYRSLVTYMDHYRLTELYELMCTKEFAE